LKVCLAVSTFEGGGIGTVVFYEAKYLAAAGHKVKIVTLLRRKNPPKGASIEEWNIGRGKVIEVNQLDCDVLHVHDSLPIIKAVRGNDVVATYHGYLPWYLRANVKEAILAPIWRLMYFHELKKNKIARIIAVSECAQNELNPLRKKTIVIENGVDTEIFQPFNNKRVIELKKEMGSPALIYVGSFYRFKGVLELLEAMLYVIRKYSQCKLTMIGYGPLEQKMRKYIHNSSLNDYVEIKGYVPHEELPFYYNASDIFVTSSFYESFGLPLIEASACGKPVIGRKIPILIEHAKKSGSMLTFDSIKELPCLISTVLSNYPVLSQNALRYGRSLSWDSHVDKLVKVYEMAHMIQSG
jgi:glycosyltransferase involved in cell wall biosynthesis